MARKLLDSNYTTNDHPNKSRWVWRMWATPTVPHELQQPQQLVHMSMNYTNLCAFNFGPNAKITSHVPGRKSNTLSAVSSSRIEYRMSSPRLVSIISIAQSSCEMFFFFFCDGNKKVSRDRKNNQSKVWENETETETGKQWKWANKLKCQQWHTKQPHGI